eukprot:Skav204203  [mRNA]  locus=scaffold985:221549:221881:+ [translate_table: standard]
MSSRRCPNRPRCDPCVMFFSTRGCANGVRCPFCHHRVADAAHRPVRPRKERRARMREAILLEIAAAKNQAEMHSNLQESARRHPYMRSVIEEYLNMSFLAPDQMQSVFRL